MPAEHEPDVPYRAEFLSDTALPEGWEGSRNAHGLYSVSGPCPACKGQAYGPAMTQLGVTTTNEDADLLYIDRPQARTREVLAACTCGAEHGKSGAGSCGREWIVRIHVEN